MLQVVVEHLRQQHDPLGSAENVEHHQEVVLRAEDLPVGQDQHVPMKQLVPQIAPNTPGQYEFSLFAQRLGTAEPVSLQRISKALAERG